MNVDERKYQNPRIKKHVFLTFLTCVTLTSSYHVTLTSNEMNWMVFLISLILTFWLDVTLTLKGTENLNSMISLLSEILTFWSGVTLTLKGIVNLNLTLNLKNDVCSCALYCVLSYSYFGIPYEI